MSDDAVITITVKGMGLLWGVSVPVASRQTRDVRINTEREGAVWLQKAIELRPIAVDQAEFETVLRQEAACADGDVVDIAREQMLWTFHYDPTPRRSGPKAGTSAAVEAATEGFDPELVHRTGRTPTKQADNGDNTAQQLAELRVARLRADLEWREQKVARERGDLIERKEIEDLLEKAGATARSVLSVLPGTLAALVPAEMRAEVRQQAELAVDQALHAICHTLTRPEDDDEDGEHDLEPTQ